MEIIILTVCILSFIVFSLRFAWWRKNISYEYPRILMYHMIRDHLPKNKSKFNRLRVKPSEFEKQVKWLSKNDWKSFTLSELVKLEKIPKKAVVLTFDDGYEDNLINALPILKKYNFKATIYIVVNRFNNDWATDKDLKKSSNELNEEKMLSNQQVQELISSGLIEIGSHTLDHSNLPSLSFEEKQKQILNAKEEIEKEFSIKCESFAYPFGFYDKNDVLIVSKNVYTNATSTVNDIYNNEKYSEYLIPRIMVSGRQNIFSFILKIKKGRNR